jgi:hypothetical protein
LKRRRRRKRRRSRRRWARRSRIRPGKIKIKKGGSMGEGVGER